MRNSEIANLETELFGEQPKKQKRICTFCNKPLHIIGTDRKNGIIIDNKNGKDWEGRKEHKKCYKKRKEIEMFRRIYDI